MRSFNLAVTIVLGSAAACGSYPGQAALQSHNACRVEADGVASGPSADICTALVQRWTSLFGYPPRPGVVRLAAGTDEYGSYDSSGWVQVWSKPRPYSPAEAAFRRESDGLISYDAEENIPHEAGHKAFSSDNHSPLQRRSDVSAYGTLAPDWLDEAVAIWMEPPSAIEIRMRSAAEAEASLTTLLTMRHPGDLRPRGEAAASWRGVQARVVTPPCSACTWRPDSLRDKYEVIETGVNRFGLVDTSVTYHSTDPSNFTSFEKSAFYGLSYSVLRFIHVNGGPEAVRELVARYRADPLPRTDVVVDLPGGPRSFAEFEEQWKEFVRHPPPER